MKKFCCVLTVFVLSLFMLVSCVKETNTAITQTEITPATRTLNDMAGREIILRDEISEIIVLSPADCEIIYALGADHLIIGRGEYCDYPEEIKILPSVQSGFETNIEQIIALAPDAVVMTVMSQSKEHADMLEEAGITVIVTDAHDIEGIYEAILLMGAVTGYDDEAGLLVDSLRTGFNDIIAVGSDKTVYFEVSPLEFGLWTTGKSTFLDEIASMLGLVNIFGDVDGWAEISQEQVIDRNPDYIVTIGMYDGASRHPINEITQRAGWEEVSAVKNDRVFMLDADEISRPGPRVLAAAQTLLEYVKE